MKKIATKKLSLNRETLRRLDAQELGAVAGAESYLCPSNFCSKICPNPQPQSFWCSADCGTLICTVVGSAVCQPK